MKRWIWMLSAAAACGPKAATTPSNETHEAAVAAATPCPADAAATARSAWGVGEGELQVDCVAVRAGGETLWWLDGYFAAPDADMVMTYSSVVTPAGETRWVDGPMEEPWGAVEKSATSEMRAVDLDGDGNDEVLWITEYSWGGLDEETLTVAKMVDGHPVFDGGEGILLSHDNSAADPDPAELSSCTATYEIVDSQIAVERSGPNCDPPGRTLYGWNGTALVSQ